MRGQYRMPVATWAVAITVYVAHMAGLSAQQAPLTPAALTPVPRVMWFSGVFRPADNLPVASVENITVAVYREPQGGDAVWRETQAVAMNADGRYSLLIGSTLADGMPLDVFTSGEPCWIGITVNRPGEVEQPRLHQVSVPYALKAADADTLGGLPASAYLRAPTADQADIVEPASAVANTSTDPPAAPDAVLPGTTNFLAKYVNAADVGNSAVYETAGAVGIGTTTPFDWMHVRFTDTSGALTGVAVQNLASTATSYSGMLFFDQNGALGQFQGFNNATHEYRINNIASGGTINFMLAHSSKFLIANNGNVGIGTNPNFKLHVLASSNAGLRVQTNTVGGTVASFGGLGDFQVDAPGIVGGRLTVTAGGNVGIGTANPAQKLSVAGTIESTGGGFKFPDGSVQTKANADGPCFDNTNRYVDCANGTVTDTVTGLIWLRQADCLATASYPAANQAAAGLKEFDCGLSDGSSPGDWRLPTNDEWSATIARAAQLGCTIDGPGTAPSLTNDAGTACYGTGSTSSFAGVASGRYWSSTTHQPSPTSALHADLVFGGPGVEGKGSAQRVWPVRGGPR